MTLRRFILFFCAAIGLLSTLGCATSKTTISRPEILLRAEWKANPAVGAPKTHEPKFITIHHTATKQKPAISLEEKLRNLQKFSQNEGTLASGKKKPAWTDVPYHFYIPCDGRIGEARDVKFVGDTNTEYDPTGHLLVVLEGNFEEEEPTSTQMNATHALVGWLAAKYQITPEKIATHKDFAKTACPGKNLHNRLGEIRQGVPARK